MDYFAITGVDVATLRRDLAAAPASLTRLIEFLRQRLRASTDECAKVVAQASAAAEAVAQGDPHAAAALIDFQTLLPSPKPASQAEDVLMDDTETWKKTKVGRKVDFSVSDENVDLSPMDIDDASARDIVDPGPPITATSSCARAPAARESTPPPALGSSSSNRLVAHPASPSSSRPIQPASQATTSANPPSQTTSTAKSTSSVSKAKKAKDAGAAKQNNQVGIKAYFAMPVPAANSEVKLPKKIKTTKKQK